MTTPRWRRSRIALRGSPAEPPVARVAPLAPGPRARAALVDGRPAVVPCEPGSTRRNGPADQQLDPRLRVHAEFVSRILVEPPATAEQRHPLASPNQRSGRCALGRPSHRPVAATGSGQHIMKRVCLLTGASGTLGTAFCHALMGDYDIVGVYCNRAPDVPSQLQGLVDPLPSAATVWRILKRNGRITAVGFDDGRHIHGRNGLNVNRLRHGLTQRAVGGVEKRTSGGRSSEFDGREEVSVRVAQEPGAVSDRDRRGWCLGPKR